MKKSFLKDWFEIDALLSHLYWTQNNIFDALKSKEAVGCKDDLTIAARHVNRALQRTVEKLNKLLAGKR